MKPGPIVAFVVILCALGFGAQAFVANLTPYLPFAEAKAQGERTVQVMGKLDKAVDIRQDGGMLRFGLIEEKTGEKMPVHFKQAKPGNFEQATQITAIGRWDGQSFLAEKLLVKCPSKYQGTESEKSYSSR